MVSSDRHGNRIFFQNLKEEKVMDYVKNYYGYNHYVSYEGYVVNTVTGEVLAQIKYERGVYNLLSRDAC